MVLCLLGFEGHGYSPDFVATMGSLKDALTADPAMALRLTAAPDDICSACPHLAPNSAAQPGCHLRGPGHEAHMAAQDREVLRRLGFVEGVQTTWATVLARVRAQVRGHDLTQICTTCPWLGLGLCASAVDRLAGPGGRSGRGEAVNGVQ